MKRIVVRYTQGALAGLHRIAGQSSAICQSEDELPLNLAIDLKRTFALSKIEKHYILYREMEPIAGVLTAGATSSTADRQPKHKQGV